MATVTDSVAKTRPPSSWLDYDSRQFSVDGQLRCCALSGGWPQTLPMFAFPSFLAKNEGNQKIVANATSCEYLQVILGKSSGNIFWAKIRNSFGKVIVLYPASLVTSNTAAVLLVPSFYVHRKRDRQLDRQLFLRSSKGNVLVSIRCKAT